MHQLSGVKRGTPVEGSHGPPGALPPAPPGETRHPAPWWANTGRRTCCHPQQRGKERGRCRQYRYQWVSPTPELVQHSEEEGQGDGQADGGPDLVEGIRVIFDKTWFLQCRLMIIRLRSSLDWSGDSYVHKKGGTWKFYLLTTVKVCRICIEFNRNQWGKIKSSLISY